MLQKADKKVIKKILKKQIPGKVLADFEETKFDEFVVPGSGDPQFLFKKSINVYTSFYNRGPFQIRRSPGT